MLKRRLNEENKENEQPSSSSSILKHADSNEPIPRKKAKILDEENVSNVQSVEPELASIDEENVSNLQSVESELPSFDEEDVSNLQSVESAPLSDDEEKGPWPISSFIEHNNGTLHPTNKQYFIYENTDLHMISRTARFWSRKYQKVLHHVNPDAYAMYIHNDFACYGELEVIENCLLDIAKGIFLKAKRPINHILAFRRLECLTIILDYADSFNGIDDGDRYDQILRVIGACYVTILRGLLPKFMFNPLDKEELNHEDIKQLNKIARQLPNFQEVIKRALIDGRTYLSIGDVCSAYTKILQTVYCNWSLIIDKVPINLNEKAEKKDEDLWEALKHAIKIKKNAFKESFDFIIELATYAGNNPDLGGNSHDLRKWSKTRRSLYSFDKSDDEDDEHFWFRM